MEEIKEWSGRLPNLVIAGVHKAATTSLFTYLQSHPSIYGPGVKEIHYFTPLRYNQELNKISEYEKHFKNVSKEHVYVLDASPSYVYGGITLIKKMNEILPPHKVIIILRNPVERFLSYYNYLKAKLFLQSSDNLDSFIKQCLNEVNQPMVDNEFSRALREGLYIDYVPDWVNFYDDKLKIIYTEDLGDNPTNVMVKIAEWLKVDGSHFREKKYTTENKTVFVKNKFFHSVALKVNHNFESFWRKNHRLKATLRDFYYSFNKKNKENENHSDALTLLKDFYKIPNQRLYQFLKERNLPLPSWLEIK